MPTLLKPYSPRRYSCGCGVGAMLSLKEIQEKLNQIYGTQQGTQQESNKEAGKGLGETLKGFNWGKIAQLIGAGLIAGGVVKFSDKDLPKLKALAAADPILADILAPAIASLEKTGSYEVGAGEKPKTGGMPKWVPWAIGGGLGLMVLMTMMMVVMGRQSQPIVMR